MPDDTIKPAALCIQEIAACSQHHTELALVSDWSPNLSFWSQMTPVTALLQGPLLPVPPYSPNCTYVAVIASDGDSLQVSYISTPMLEIVYKAARAFMSWRHMHAACRAHCFVTQLCNHSCRWRKPPSAKSRKVHICPFSLAVAYS